MSRSTSFSLLRVSGLLSIAAAALVAACAGSDVPVRGDGVGTGGSQSGSNGGSANAGSGGDDGEGGTSMSGGDGGSGMPSGGTGGDDSTDNGGSGGGGDPDCDGAAILLSSCGIAGCHGPGGSFNAFAEDEADLAAALDEDPTLSAPTCGVLIDSANAADGLIYKKVAGTQGACGGQMPPGAPLPAADQACVEQFLDGLAE